jgi:hypothetical protein
VRIAGRGTLQFWQLYRALPPEVRTVARKNNRPWQINAFHPSLHFKSIGQLNWSVRIGDHHRGFGRFIDDVFVWEWIGSHADYDKRF